MWVCIHKDGWIKEGNCSCVAGLASTCSHVAALLIKLAVYIELKLNMPDAPTDQLCMWNASKRRVSAAPLSAISFSKPKHKTLPKKLKEHWSITPSFCCSDPTTGKHALSATELTKLFKIKPDACLFKQIDLDNIIKVKKTNIYFICSTVIILLYNDIRKSGQLSHSYKITNRNLVDSGY